MTIGEQEAATRSTIFEYDLQLFMVTFVVEGTKIHSIRMFIPELTEMEYTKLANVGSGTFAAMTLSIDRMTTFKWVERFDEHVKERFLEKYVPKAMIRRIR